MTLIIHDNKYILMTTIIIGGHIYVLMKQPVGDTLSRNHVEKYKTHAWSARLIMHTHIVTQFLVRGGSIYQWKIGQGDTRRWTLVRETLVRDRIGVLASLCSPRIYKARAQMRERRSLSLPLLHPPRARMQRVHPRRVHSSRGMRIVPRARLIKRQGVSRVTNVVWRGTRGYSLQPADSITRRFICRLQRGHGNTNHRNVTRRHGYIRVFNHLNALVSLFQKRSNIFYQSELQVIYK